MPNPDPIKVLLIESDRAAIQFYLEALCPLTDVTVATTPLEAAPRLREQEALVAHLRDEPQSVLGILEQQSVRSFRLPTVLTYDASLPQPLLDRAQSLGCRLLQKPHTATEIREALLLALTGVSRLQ